MAEVSMTCECGGVVSTGNGKGRFFSHGAYGQVKLMLDCEVRFCDECGRAVIGVDDYSLFNALNASLGANVEELLAQIKGKHKIYANKVASFMGMQPETLSRYQSETQVSPPVYRELIRIAKGGSKYIKGSLSEKWDDAVADSGAGSGGEYRRSIVAAPYR